MYCVDEILKKLNDRDVKKNNSAGARQVTLSDIMVRSFPEVKNLAGDNLSWGEANFLYKEAQKEYKNNKIAESRILSRANPQLENAVRLGIRQSSMLQGYNDVFPERASKFVKPGAVSSMFSPAGYLTELYRESRNLHADTSQYHLDTRRPDLASLSLSQSNMDDELSTLTLSNELLVNSIQTKENKNYDGVMEILSTYRQTGVTPFHLPYEAVRQSIILQDEEFTAFRRNPDVVSLANTTSLLTIEANLSPELLEVLTEKITEGNAEELLKNNFGEDVDIQSFQSLAYQSRYYGISHDDMTSMMNMLIFDHKIGYQYYVENRYLSAYINEGVLSSVNFIRYDMDNKLRYVEIFPLSHNTYQVNYNFNDDRPAANYFSITSSAGTLYENKNFTPVAGENYSAVISLSDAELDSGKVVLSFNRGATGPSLNSSVTFSLSFSSFSFNVLRMNKIIRLYKSTKLSASILRRIIESCNNEMTVDSKVLNKLFLVRYYMRHYSLDIMKASALSCSLISLDDYNDGPNDFDKLFNTPPLNKKNLYPDSTSVTLAPNNVTDTFRTGVLKRAFEVNDTELFTLWALAQGTSSPTDFTTEIANLSALYRIKLLADVHGLSVTELAAFISISPYASTAIATLDGNGFSELVSLVDMFTTWMKDQHLAVGDLYLMSTTRHSTTLTPDIENFIATLKNGMGSQDLSNLDDVELNNALAPFIAAAIQLDSAEIADVILQWLDQLKPQELAVRDFLALVDNDNRLPGDTTKLVSFCQVMGQLALIVRNLALTPGEISLAVTQPQKFFSMATILPVSIATVRTLSRFHSWLQQCGTNANEMLSALSNDTLTALQLARAMDLDEQMVQQAFELPSRTDTVIKSWTKVDIILQWMDIASTLGVTPVNVHSLMNLGYTSPNPTYQDWVAVSHALQAGLTTRQTAQLQAALDESISGAVSAWVIKNIAPSWVTNRDQLYSWLLIDNQVSAQVKTTRLAEATASVQLYVNRALSGQEEGVVSTVKARQFFTDWDTYNKRYSTWAGVSQLVYYPENYVDPTMRLGQTGMMDEMLQSLSQSQLTSDTVEDAFKTYMTRFEEIANLDIVSGYHDSVSDQNGITYLIGKSAIGDYYWRSADIEKMLDGKLPANAWSEWKKITAAVSPIGNLVRPVIFQSRLYLVWVEGKEVSATDGSTITKITEYSLKYAHILHDGTWSAPVSVKPETDILPPKDVNINNTGMYCARDAEQEKLYLYFYQKETSYDGIPKTIAGLSILSDGSTESIISDISTETAGYIYKQLDTTTDIRLNTPYAGGDTRVSISSATRTDYQWGDSNYTIMFGSTLSDMNATVSESKVSLPFNATARVVTNGVNGGESGILVSLMKAAGDFGGQFYLPHSTERGSYASSYDFNLRCVANKLNASFYFDPLNNYLENGKYAVYYDANIDSPSVGYQTLKTTNGLFTRVDNRATNPVNVFACRSNPFPAAGYDFKFSNFKYIHTGIWVDDVHLSVTGTGVSESFVAKACPKYTWDESLFSFTGNTLTIPLSAFSGNTADINFAFSASAPPEDGRSVGSETLRLTLTRVTSSTLPVITLNRTDTYAQYLQYGAYRIRVNTLFAKQLVARANTGLNAVLTMDTQQLQEPKLGKGFYVDFNLPAYDVTTHGSSRNFTLNLKHVVDNNVHVVYSGMLADSEISVRLFVPLDEKPLYPAYCAKVFLITSKTGDGSWKGAHFKYTDSGQTAIEINPLSDISMFNSVVILPDATEPMDFSGANAIYFWEMFYYVPMMVFKRLLNEGKFTEATQWIKYVWSPDGYLLNGTPATYQWNVRPLEEETSWQANPLDSVDPDAVAQADPLHYKVATFMSYLDLLIARGDVAYRQLERDTLNEAKMWYVQALDILGDEPYLAQDTSWISPRLTDAADQTAQTRAQQAMLAVRQQVASGELRTANSLTALFLPQQNEKLAGYWQTLAQRLYNLRHNLSIDGQPLSLAIYAKPADPAALLSAAVNASQGGSDLPAAVMPLYRFPVMLESARGMVGQLSQFGSTLLSITERQDAEALSELLQTQGSALVLQSVALQDKEIEAIDADKAALEESRSGAQSRLNSYTSLYDENVNTGETQAMNLYLSSSSIAAGATALHMTAAALEMVPNIYGMALGGSRYGVLLDATAIGLQVASDSTRIAGDRISQSEAYRRRRQEWEIQRNAAESDVKQIDAQLASLAVRREAAVLQKTYLETQQAQTQAQMTFLQNKFSNKALYNWLRGKLAAIYYQFYDLTVSRCLMAEKAWQWECNDEATSFVRPGAWQGTYAGLLAGETLMLNLAQMEKAYLEQDQRALEVTRTVCLSEVYAGLSTDAFALADKVTELVNATKGNAGTDDNGLKIADKQLQATLKLSELAIKDDYPDNLGTTRRIKQISVTLPALVGPYQDVRAVLSYGGSVVMPRGCKALAVSHGMNDSGQFQLDFNDPRYLPFEGIPVGDEGTLTLSFPDADSKQKALLLSLTDIIVHIRYTIL